MHNPPLNAKGFTLYTALLSFILILLAALLVNTMINAERISNEVVLEVEAQSRMQGFADLTRADALQVVNYGIRNAIEEYTQNEGNAYPYSSETQDWDHVTADFSQFFFGGPNGSILAGRIAANLSVIVTSQPRNIGGYTVTIEGGNESQLKAAIQDVLFQTSLGGEKFLQVVDCDIDEGPEACVGTFYVNLDFSTIGEETYEALPSIHVKDVSTQRELVEPVIPRGKFRIYVPLRVFRALRYAHDIAGGTFEGGTGLLSDEFHAKLDELGVGMCDGSLTPEPPNCGYRTQPFTIASPPKLGPGPSGPNGGFLCPAEQAGLSALESLYPKNVSLVCDTTAAALGFCTLGGVIKAYDPADAVSRADALNEVVKSVINNSVTVDLALPDTEDFVLLTDSLLIEPRVTSFDSTIIQFEGIDGIPPTNGKCTKLVETNVVLTFEETNPNYIVVDSRSPLEYDVRIVDTFVKSTNPPRICVSYCLEEELGFGTVIFGPELNADPGVCLQTACAPAGTYEPPHCGNGIVDAGEECDTQLTPTQSCNEVNPSFAGGTATCDATCHWDTTACLTSDCGNGIVESPETCDPMEVTSSCAANQSCVGEGLINECTCAPLAPGTP